MRQRRGTCAPRMCARHAAVPRDVRGMHHRWGPQDADRICARQPRLDTSCSVSGGTSRRGTARYTNGLISGCVSTAQTRGQHVLTLLDTTQAAGCQSGQTSVTWRSAALNGTGVYASSVQTFQPGSGGVAQVFCPNGMVALSGGYSLSSDPPGTPGNISESAPLGPDNFLEFPALGAPAVGWEVRTDAAGTSLGRISAWVVCANAT
jgi:hypothetical protein